MGESGSWARNIYVGGDPVNFLDAKGLEGCPANSSYCVDVTANGGMSPAEFCRIHKFNSWCNSSHPDPHDPATSQPAPRISDPSVFLDLAKYYQKAVAAGDLTDCEAFAAYADFVDVNMAPGSRWAAFRPFLPASEGGGGIRLAGNFGFRSDLNDRTDPGSDQTHHFAAFFAQGIQMSPNSSVEDVANYLVGISAGWEVYGWFRDFQKTWKYNTPDVTLGIMAGLIGYEMGRAGDEQTHVGYMIRSNLCR